MKKEDLKNIPEEKLLQIIEMHLEAERRMSNWNDRLMAFLQEEKAEPFRFLLAVLDEPTLKALFLIFAEEGDSFRKLTFPSSRTIEAAWKRLLALEYEKARRAGFNITQREIARLCEIGSVPELRRYIQEAEKREKERESEQDGGERIERRLARIRRFLQYRNAAEGLFSFSELRSAE